MGPVVAVISGIIAIVFLAICGYVFIKNRFCSGSNFANKKTSSSTSDASILGSRKRPMFHVITGDLKMPSTYEFEELGKKEKMRPTLTTEHGSLKKNKSLNSNKGIVPYDQNRVKLKYSKNETDYINGTWINLPETEGAYDTLIIHPYLPSSQLGVIVSQTPISNTMDHHLLMIYENNIDIAISISSKPVFH